MKISVLLADDHAIVRQGIRAVLELAEDIDVVGEAADGLQTLHQVRELEPDVVVLDVAMPVLNGLETARVIADRFPDTKVLILSTWSDDESVQKLLNVGARGYLSKRSAANELVSAIRQTHEGRSVFSPCIAKRLRDRSLENFARGTAARRKSQGLTGRETAVLQLIAEGLLNKQIADQLKISAKTVEKHRQNLMKKLNLHDVASLTRYAISKGLVASKVIGNTVATGPQRAPGPDDWFTRP